MPTQAQVKMIHGLRYKKYRRKNGLFVAEGPHLVEALMTGDHTLVHLYATNEGMERLRVQVPSEKTTLVSDKTLTRLSNMNSHQGLLALVALPNKAVSGAIAQQQWVLGIDGIQDPGNLGTIIRTADWFGFPYLICSPATVDAFNPKVVQASMGSIFHTAVEYAKLPEWVRMHEVPVYGLTKHGGNLYETDWPRAGFLLVGHETQGISQALEPLVAKYIRIPGFGQAESLNAAVATAVTLAQLRANLTFEG